MSKDIKNAANLSKDQKKRRALKLTGDIAADILAGLLIGFGTYNFTVAAEFPMVGISGIALIFYHLMNIPIGVSSIILNIPIALICYKALGKDFFVRSIRSIMRGSAVGNRIWPYLHEKFFDGRNGLHNNVV